jgi:transposase InsO family protein
MGDEGETGDATGGVRVVYRSVLNLVPPQQFDCELDGGISNPQRWNNWVDRFNIYLQAQHITEDADKIFTFLHCAGEKIWEIYNVNKTGTENYTQVVKIIKDYFEPSKNLDYLILKFRQCVQRQGESIDEYVVRLKILASVCEFANADLEIKIQIIQGSNSKQVQLKGAQGGNTLNDLIKFARSVEGLPHHSKVLYGYVKQEEVPIKHESVNKVYTNARSTQRDGNSASRYQSKSCFNCGKEYPHEGNCPAFGIICHTCKKKNHFARCCPNRDVNRSQQKQNSNIQRTTQTYSQGNNRRPYKTHQVTNIPDKNSNENRSNLSHYEHCDDNSEFEPTDYNVMNVTREVRDKDDHVKRQLLPRRDVKMLNTSISIGVDSQCSVNCLRYSTYSQLVNKPRLIEDISITRSADTRLRLVPCGLFYTDIELNGSVLRNVKFHVYKYLSDDLLSYETCNALNILPNLIQAIDLDANSIFEKQIHKQYPSLFNGKIGKLKDFKLKLHIDTNVKPVQQAERRIPFHLREKVKSLIVNMENDDLIEDAKGPTSWVSEMVLVPKPNEPNELRVVSDSREANTAILRERHNTPTIDDLMVDLNQAKFISKLDLKGGYHQIEIDESSRYITTFRTPFGLKQYKRLTMGICCASEMFQHIVENVLSGLDGVKNLQDDIFIHGSTFEEHNKRLHATLQRLSESNLTLNQKKCEFCKTSLQFFGLQFSCDGIAVTEAKVKALREAKSPQTKAELRSFLGLATYCSRYIQKLADKASILWDLCKKNSKWTWSNEHESNFNSIKASICTNALSYFNKDWSTIVEVDASPVGAAAVLIQQNPYDPDDRKVVSFWSQVFSDTEKRYSQVEKEALAVVLACERFRLYIIGNHFTLKTDNKAVEIILRNPRSKPPARIERWNLRLMEYDFTVEHKRGIDNFADYLSRNPIDNGLINRQTELAENYVAFIQSEMAPAAITIDKIIAETKNDKIIQEVINWLCNSKSLDSNYAKQYAKYQNELSVSNERVLLRGNRIVIPSNLQAEVVKIAHEGHQGLVKTKRLLRDRVWFPGIDNMVENLISSCKECQLNNGGNYFNPLKPNKMPDKPWQRVAIDFHGPLHNGHELMVVIDEYSRFPVVIEVNSTSFKYVVPQLENLFTLMGIPEQIKSDNGPPFNGHEFANFCTHFGIKHNKVTPLYPQANGLCENFMKNLNKIIKNSVNSNISYKEELLSFLRSYRSTPHSSTNVTPSSLIFKRADTTRLPSIKNYNEESIDLQAKSNDNLAKFKMKFYADKHNRAKQHDFKVGDKLILNQHVNKHLHNKYENEFMSQAWVVINVRGDQLVVQNKEGKMLVRNAAFFKHKTFDDVNGEFEAQVFGYNSDTSNDDNSKETEVSQPQQIEAPLDIPRAAFTKLTDNQQPQQVRRSTRNKVQTKFYGEPVRH